MNDRGLTRRRLKSAALSSLAAVLVLAGCSAPAPAPAPATTPTKQAEQGEQAILPEHGLDGLDAAQIIERLDALEVADRPADLMASIQPDELILTGERNAETTVPMPQDEFYVSVAPYVTRTHDCYFHSLTTCLGELRNTSVSITVIDDATGEVVLEETRETFDNGFVGLWLPRGIDATLTISAEGRTATAPISTVHDDDPTCLTTLRLT